MASRDNGFSIVSGKEMGKLILRAKDLNAGFAVKLNNFY